MRTYMVQLPWLEILAPTEISPDDLISLKEYVWNDCKSEILQYLTIQSSEIETDGSTRTSQYEINHYATAKPKDEYDQRTSNDGTTITTVPFRLPISRNLPLQIKSPNHSVPKKIDLLNTIARVQRQFFQSESPKVIFGGLLEALLELLDSEYGFIGEIKYEDDGTKYLQTHAITNIAWDAATHKFYEDNISNGLKFTNLHSLFGDVIVNEAPVIANNPKSDPRACGVPKGHPSLNHFLGVPFFMPGGEMNGMVGISNKPGGYCKDDIEFLEPFTVTCGNLINAFNQIKKNKYLIDTLEDSVKKRTFELESANKELAQANQQVLLAKQLQLQHFACMSHEIRTPLNCVIGMASLLKESKMGAMQQEAVEMIVSSGDLLLAIVNDVLDYSKLETEEVKVHVEESALQETITLVLNSVVSKANPNQSIQSYFDCMVPEKIHTDSRRLQQILFNLLGNSIKFSPPDGIIKLSVEIVTIPKQNNHNGKSIAIRENGITTSEFNVAESQDMRFLRFTVDDNGKGIDENDLKRIFQPFQQASSNAENVYGGTGLGLSITQKIVTALGGTINVTSKKGEWTKFTVDFPCTEPPVNIEEISKRVEHYVVYVVGVAHDKEGTVHNMLSSFGIQLSFFNTLRDLIERRQMEPVPTHQISICLLNEDCFVDEMIAALSKVTIITFGPKFSVDESKCAFHFRSFDYIIPSYFINHVIRAVSNINQKRSSLKTVKSDEFNSYTDMRILIAEDNLVNQKVLTRILHRLGAVNIEIAGNGLEACNKEEKELFDLILMDQQMPIMGGIAACKQILNRGGDHIKPTIVFATAHVSHDFEKDCAEAGGSGFVPKPFKLDDIETCLRTVYRSRMSK